MREPGIATVAWIPFRQTGFATAMPLRLLLRAMQHAGTLSTHCIGLCGLLLVAAAASAQEETSRAQLMAWCSNEETISSCLYRGPQFAAAHQQEPFSSEELARLERAAVRELARRDYFDEQADKLLDVVYSRSDLNPPLDEVIEAARSEDIVERYRGILRLRFLSRSELPPAAWEVLADIVRDPRDHGYQLCELAAGMLVTHRQRGGPDVEPIFLEGIRRHPPFAQLLAKNLSVVEPHEKIARYALDRTLPAAARHDLLRGSSRDWTGKPIPRDLEHTLWTIAESDPDYGVRQAAADSLRQYRRPRPWRTVLEDQRMHRRAKENLALTLGLVPALIVIPGLFLVRRWVLAGWILVSVWLAVLYGAFLLIGLAHGRARDFEPLVIALAITGVVQCVLLFLGFRQRRARLAELDYT
jgi:hypothetical protein